MKSVEKSIDLGGKTLTLSTGKLAGQADRAILAQYGDTIVLATVVSSPLSEDKGYFPLSVEYQERLYAGGKIKGSRWVKREGRPTDQEILNGRIIDRSIRPLFPESYKNEVQVIVSVLQVDMENDPVIAGANAVSAALASSDIPWSGPITVLNVGTNSEGFVLNPKNSEEDESSMSLIVSQTTDAIVMIEAGAKEVSEDQIVKGIEFASKESEKLIKFINDFASEVGFKKEAVEAKTYDKDLEQEIKKLVGDKISGIAKALATKEKGASDKYDAILDAVVVAVGEENAKEAVTIFDKLFKSTIREIILGGSRPDGRKHDEIRKLSSEVGLFKRTHGSALFTRGQTQALTIATLGAPSLGQLLESAEGEEEVHYIHHYSMPPYSTGETGKFGFQSRREIGHGYLATRALLPVIPTQAEFPYTIRLVSELVSSNGSTSMASTCGSTLSLMDAGVPIKAPVGGIAMGLVIKNDKEYAILSDICGLEDGNGDMDFKVAGTESGVTAMQMDVKTLNLTLPILKKALTQAKEGRAFILSSMIKTIDKPRVQVSLFAPKIKTTKIDVTKIGELIGPSGKNIKKIIAESGAEVDVEDDGTVNISAIEESAVQKALTMVEQITKEVMAGEVYEGTVKRIESFGAFIEILPGKEGMVHVSDMATEYVGNPNEKVKLGDKVQVRVKEIDNLGRINLSMILDPGMERPKTNGRDVERKFSAHTQRSGGREQRMGMGRRSVPNDRARSGPHFPTSRLIPEKGKTGFGRG